MGVATKIQWADHTWNPWRGCTKVSPGCQHCYAESLSKRNPSVLGEWGDRGRRAIAADSYWQQPIRWDREAVRDGVRRRVFFSLGDPFEMRTDLVEPRERLFDTIQSTPHLDWLLLTKRPGSIWLANAALGWDVYEHGMPPNVWLGTSVEDQRRADERIPALAEIPAAVRFLSVEPLLGPVDLSRFLGFQHEDEIGVSNPDQSLPRGQGVPFHDPWVRGPDWVIVGGESGPGARPCDLAWVRSIRDQCRAAGVACFVKQDMGPKPSMQGRLPDDLWAVKEFPR